MATPHHHTETAFLNTRFAIVARYCMRYESPRILKRPGLTYTRIRETLTYIWNSTYFHAVILLQKEVARAYPWCVVVMYIHYIHILYQPQTWLYALCASSHTSRADLVLPRVVRSLSAFWSATINHVYSRPSRPLRIVFMLPHVFFVRSAVCLWYK